MKNKESLIYFNHLAKNNPTKKSVKVAPKNDHTELDSKFILQYCNKKTTILDLASGSGLIINKIFQQVKSITAIELFPEFSKFITNNKKIKIVNEDISTYQADKQYDLITMFGISQYFNKKEITNIYKKYCSYLKSNGKLIIKNQFGVNQDVVVSGYSENLKTDYFSEYRHLEKEINILNNAGLKNIKVIDIYPLKYNRWKNTHFYAIIAEK